MRFEDFLPLGLNVNEAKVYAELLRHKRADARTLVKELEMHKNIVYDNLYKLLDKALISFIVEDGKKIFITESPLALQEYMARKQEELDEQKASAAKLIEDIRKLKEKTQEREEAVIMRGKQGVRALMEEIYRTAEGYIAFGVPEEATNIMGEAYWEWWHRRQHDKGIPCRMLLNESLRGRWVKSLSKYENEKLRFLRKELEPMTETLIWEENTAIIVWAEKPIITLIRNKHVASSYETFFEMLWQQAKH